MSQHHLPETVLAEYSAGTSAEPVSLMVATHMTLCESCRSTVDMLDEVGGALLESVPGSLPHTCTDHPLEHTEDIPDALLKRMLDDDEPSATAGSDSEYEDFLDVVMPRPLREYVGCPIHEIPWRKLTGSLDVFDILTEVDGYSTRLMRVASGAAMPRHTHEGEEYTLILQGGMSDHHGVYHRGDVAVANPDVEHSPQALPDDDCICLAVNAKHVRLTGPIGRWFNPFVKF